MDVKEVKTIIYGGAESLIKDLDLVQQWHDDPLAALETWNRITGRIEKNQFLLAKQPDPERDVTRLKENKNYQAVLVFIEENVPQIRQLIAEYQAQKAEYQAQKNKNS